MSYDVFQGFGLDPTEVFNPNTVKDYLRPDPRHHLYNEGWADFVKLWSNTKQLQIGRPHYETALDQPTTQELELIIPDSDSIVSGPQAMLYIPNPSIGVGSVTFMDYDTALDYLANGLVQIASTRYAPHDAALPDLDDIRRYLDFYFDQYPENPMDLTLITQD